jgi:hypothetical protein
LRRFARPRNPAERCELCAAEIPPEHQHLFELIARQVICACDACSLSFTEQVGMKYQRVPRRIEFWPDFHLSDQQWNALNIPIQLAFFFHSTSAGRIVTMYPSPAGTIESLLPLESWQELTEQNPVLSELEPNVEALLVNRVGDRRQCFRAPIDQCYKLAGLIRTSWHGLGGGAKVWGEIDQFFADLQAHSSPMRKRANA